MASYTRIGEDRSSERSENVRRASLSTFFFLRLFDRIRLKKYEGYDVFDST